MSKKIIPSKKIKLQKLSYLCRKHFGKNFEQWNWIINNDHDYYSESKNKIIHTDRLIGAAIELPKYDINNNLIYTDPFIGKSTGETKALLIACDDAIQWIENNFI